MWFFRRKKKKKESEEVVLNKQQEQEVEVVEEEVLQDDTQDLEPTKEKQQSKKPAKYHVSQNKDDKSENHKKWRVRKEGSTKTIKFFNTQVEAIDFAQGLADKAGSSIVIHKVDGSIRKQDYTNK